MQKYLEHPTEEALERFLLQRSDEEELDLVETHILACGECVTRLEKLEALITDIKIAAQEWQQDARREQRSSEKRSWKTWFTVPNLSWAGAAAALVLGIAAIPLFIPRDVKLTAYRDNQVTQVPEWRPVRMQLNAEDLPQGPVAVQLLNWNGSDIWSGTSTVRNELVEVELPRLTKSGNYFLRLYAQGPDHAQGDVLREFAFQVR